MIKHLNLNFENKYFKNCFSTQLKKTFLEKSMTTIYQILVSFLKTNIRISDDDPSINLTLEKIIIIYYSDIL